MGRLVRTLCFDYRPWGWMCLKCHTWVLAVEYAPQRRMDIARRPMGIAEGYDLLQKNPLRETPYFLGGGCSQCPSGQWSLKYRLTRGKPSLARGPGGG